MPFYFNGSTLSLTIMVSKIYLMIRIKGDVSFQRHRISQLNMAYLVMTDCKKQEKMSFFRQVLREIAMVSYFLTFKVALNLVSHYFIFLVHLLGMFSHIQYVQSTSLIFRKCSKYFKTSKLLPTSLEQKRKL